MSTVDDHLIEPVGKLHDVIGAVDWAATSLGPIQGWPAFVKAAAALLVESRVPMASFWGPEGVILCNHAFAELAGASLPALLGKKILESWPALSDLNHQALEAGLAGRVSSFHGIEVTLSRHGIPETLELDLDYSPIRDEADCPVGILMQIRKLERQGAADRARLQAAEVRHRCLVELGTRLRACTAPGEISGAVAEVLGPVLGCVRTGYALISGEHALIVNDWTNGPVASLRGQYAFSALGPTYTAHIDRGEILAVADILTHPVTADSIDLWRDIDVRALLNVPMLQNGVPVGLLYAHESQPRDWTHDEVLLVQEVADRTWEAMGRAHAAEALGRLNETLEAQVRERTLQRDRMWALSTDIMMVTNHETKILSVNPAWTRLLGWQEDELIGASFYDFVHPDDLVATRSQRQKLDEGQRVEKWENRYRTKQGGFVWLSWKAVPDGGLFHSVGRDVTAEREQAEALQAAEEALRQAQKMEAIGQLTGGIAHDFNNLLQGISGALDLSQNCIEHGRIDQLAGYNAQARRSIERAAALTHRLLAFSRRQRLDPRPVQVNALLASMEPLLRRTVGESIRLEFDLAPDLWLTLCDPHQLDSAVLNLAINARDAMQTGGTLTIRTSNVPGNLGAGDIAPGPDQICLAVADTGCGMPATVIKRAFDPFYTTKPTGQGTGLGLSMVYGFMQQSGGLAEIQSALNEGTTVRLYLPRYADQDFAEIPDGPQAQPLETGPQSERGVVLVIEDEFLVRSIIVEVIEGLGFEVMQAADGPSGLEIIQSSCDIDLVVTDIGLPGLNGRQVAEAGRVSRPTLKILFMTGYADAAVLSEGFLAPGMELIAKPFSIDAFAARFQSMMRP